MGKPELLTEFAAMVDGILTEEEVAILVKGPTLGTNGKGVIDCRPGKYFAVMKKLMEAQSKYTEKDKIHLAFGITDMKASIGILPMVIDDGTIKVAMQWRNQPQIGTGRDLALASPSGGFLLTAGHKSPEAQAAAHVFNKIGVEYLVPRYLPFRPVLKTPYGVTNQGYANDTGKVIGGDIYGIVWLRVVRFPTYMMEPMSQFVAEQARKNDKPDEKLVFLSLPEFRKVAGTDACTLDPEEIEFYTLVLSGDIKEDERFGESA